MLTVSFTAHWGRLFAMFLQWVLPLPCQTAQDSKSVQMGDNHQSTAHPSEVSLAVTKAGTFAELKGHCCAARRLAKGVKPKGSAGGSRQGWISLPVIRCHKHPLFHVAEVSQICVPRKTSLYYMRSLEYSLSKGLLLLANPNGPQGRRDGRGSQAMKGNLQIPFGKTV